MLSHISVSVGSAKGYGGHERVKIFGTGLYGGASSGELSGDPPRFKILFSSA